jgi:hypothetical protein
VGVSSRCRQGARTPKKFSSIHASHPEDPNLCEWFASEPRAKYKGPARQTLCPVFDFTRCGYVLTG